MLQDDFIVLGQVVNTSVVKQTYRQYLLKSFLIYYLNKRSVYTTQY
jgi:hypothetical protein